MKYMKWTIMMTVLLVFAMFTGCAGGAQENDRQQPADQAARKKAI